MIRLNSFHPSCIVGHKAIVEFLLKNDAIANVTTFDRLTLLRFAELIGNFENFYFHGKWLIPFDCSHFHFTFILVQTIILLLSWINSLINSK